VPWLKDGLSMPDTLGAARRKMGAPAASLCVLFGLWLFSRLWATAPSGRLPAPMECAFFCAGLVLARWLPRPWRVPSPAVPSPVGSPGYEGTAGPSPDHAPLPQGTQALLAILARALNTGEVALFVRRGGTLLCRAQAPMPFGAERFASELTGLLVAGSSLRAGMPCDEGAKGKTLTGSQYRAVVPLYPAGESGSHAKACWALLLAQRAVAPLEPADHALVASIAEQIAVSLQLEQALRDAQADRLRLEYMATTDALTELANRRHFMRIFALQLARAKRYHRKLALIFLDIDHFKAVNDTYGHATGDAVLKSVAQVLRGTARGTDTVARYGGEEFAILMEETGPQGAQRIAERIREALQKVTFGPQDAPFSKTVSVGVATFPEHGDEPEHLIACADDALYQAKRGGRDRITLYRGPKSPKDVRCS
jgi:diguanylate cyclase (GGDEF)-like protein